MRRALVLIFLALFVSPVAAEDHCHELGHHWANPSYSSEMLHQMMLIFACVVVWAFAPAVWRLIRAK